MPKPSKKLIEETKAIIRLYNFLGNEVGLKTSLSARDLKGLALALKTKKGLKFGIKSGKIQP